MGVILSSVTTYTSQVTPGTTGATHLPRHSPLCQRRIAMIIISSEDRGPESMSRIRSILQGSLVGSPRRNRKAQHSPSPRQQPPMRFARGFPIGDPIGIERTRPIDIAQLHSLGMTAIWLSEGMGDRCDEADTGSAPRARHSRNGEWLPDRSERRDVVRVDRAAAAAGWCESVLRQVVDDVLDDVIGGGRASGYADIRHAVEPGRIDFLGALDVIRRHPALVADIGKPRGIRALAATDRQDQVDLVNQPLQRFPVSYT